MKKEHALFIFTSREELFGKIYFRNQYVIQRVIFKIDF